MIKREAQLENTNLFAELPAVGVLGTRQVSKTTLAEEIAASMKPDPIYLDLESPADQARLSEPEEYFIAFWRRQMRPAYDGDRTLSALTLKEKCLSLVQEFQQPHYADCGRC